MNLYIANLSAESTEAKLRELFSEFGAVGSVKVVMDPQTGVPRGFGFVEMPDNEQSHDAIDNLDATFFLGNIISVKEARPATSRPGSNRSFNRSDPNSHGTQYGDKSNRPARPRTPRNDNFGNSNRSYSKPPANFDENKNYNQSNPNSGSPGSEKPMEDKYNSLDYNPNSDQ